MSSSLSPSCSTYDSIPCYRPDKSKWKLPECFCPCHTHKRSRWSFWLQLGPAPALPNIWGVNEQMEYPKFSLELCLSNQYIFKVHSSSGNSSYLILLDGCCYPQFTKGNLLKFTELVSEGSRKLNVPGHTSEYEGISNKQWKIGLTKKFTLVQKHLKSMHPRSLQKVHTICMIVKKLCTDLQKNFCTKINMFGF